jgi:two-component system, OmpR family, sensor histidine kinase BaeS
MEVAVKRTFLVALLVIGIVAACGAEPVASGPPADLQQGYLAHADLPNSLALLPPAPAPDSAAQAYDEAVNGQLLELRDANLQAALIALGVALLSGGFLAYRFTRPIIELTDVARRYAQGERGLRAPSRGRDEVAELAEVFNRTVDQLQEEQDFKQRFMTDIAHELRTPLTVLKSELEAIQDGLMEADADTVAQLVNQVDLLTRLVQDLRLLTLAEAGELTLRRVPTDLAELANAAVSAFASQADAKGVELRCDAERILLEADRERLKQVLFNLVDNALRHAPAGGWVKLELKREAGAAILAVSDNGPGIPAEQLPRLFERFFRGDAARSRETGGSGLGLAIAKAIVVLHGGSIRALNLLDGGARFEVRLPLGDGG